MDNEMKIGYYVVKFYNYKRKMLLFWNGKHFEKFPSDESINDEIETYTKITI